MLCTPQYKLMWPPEKAVLLNLTDCPSEPAGAWMLISQSAVV